MGYTKVIQSGDVTEVYQYEKQFYGVPTHQKTSRSRRKKTSANAQLYRAASSIQRARRNFFRLVQSNLAGGACPLFVTLTVLQDVSIEVAYSFLNSFIKNVRRNEPNTTYIAVPEWQPKSGKIHFHCLFWGGQICDCGSRKACYTEIATRNYQRQFYRGFVDVRHAYNASSAIAGYMAKYLVKALQDERLRNRRAYTSSHTIKRPRTAGSNSLIDYMGEIVDERLDIKKVREYDTMYLGRCLYKMYEK